MKQQDGSRSYRFAGNTPVTVVEVAGPESLVGLLLPQPAGAQTTRGVPCTADLLVAADRLMSWVAARQAELVAALHGEVQGHAVRVASGPGARSGVGSGLGLTLSAEELAPLLNLSGRAAHRLLGQSLALVEDLPKTLQCLGMGVLSVRQALVIVDEALTVPADVVPGYEGDVLKSGAQLTSPRLKATCRRVRERLHPESIELVKFSV
ncbi:DUF222 domain-containing protein [Arthrobacter sp. H20]|uniref:DUF222 domain-containing protein n=1 Tax=Arthrobacter sp. H20 TaxID=1267981 RepID=UPI00047DC5AE|nr:DUF222 domain-containing protein [Arthrobacter sp. H20]